MDFATWIGTLLGAVAIVGGALIEGLHPGDVVVGTAALIVIGGTFAATFVSFPSEDIGRAIALLPVIFLKVDREVSVLIDEIVTVANLARKEGVLAIEGRKESLTDPLLRGSLHFVVDGFDAPTVREIIEAQIQAKLESEEAAAKVWEGAGGYAPTIGIIGAVLGLIHVMRRLDDPSRIGGGIAIAFVATIYGVALANLVFLPWGTKLKRKAQQRTLRLEVLKHGLAGIQDGINPHFLREKLEAIAK
jgi:chemotaxis protein MotA